MAYLALYRKYRPKKFDEVVGQDEIVQILKNQILSDRIGHAYLLTGIRGTGKTSIAKIFAKAVNCQSNSDGNPCNQCDICRNIDQAGVMDIIEIDGASNRGVDEIREIRDKVIYPPKIGRYKVYIIDEVHMLTKEAFNALLKTLEEPPSHIIFILATTEPNKLPATILSRCQRFDIRPITQDKIAAQLRFILEDNHVAMDDEAIQLVAARGDHSMRDALSILDQVIDIRKENESITAEAVMQFLGMTAHTVILELITAVLNNDAVQVVQLLNQLKQKGTDNLLLVGQIIDVLRQMIIVKTVGKNAEKILETGRSEIASLEAAGEGIERKRLFKIIADLIEDRQKMRYHDCSDIILEMALLKQCETEDDQENIRISEKVPVRQKVTIKTEPIQKTTVQQEKHKNHTEAVIVPEPEEKPKAVAALNDEIKTESIETDQQVNDEKISAEVQPIQEEPKKSQDGTNQTALLCQAIETWNRSQDFFTGQIVSFGNLKYIAPGQYAMVFHAPEHNMYAEMFGGRIQHQVETVMAEALGEKVHLSVECSAKSYDEMDIAEKTAAIVGDQYKSKIQVND